MAFSEPRQPLARWLVASLASTEELSAENRQILLANLFTRTAAIVFASICEIAVCVSAVWLHPKALYAGWLAAVLALLAIRLTLIRVSCVLSDRQKPTPTSMFVFASVLWSVLLGSGVLLCNISGDQTLFLLGNVCAVGVVGGLAGRNAGTPRLVMVQVSIIFGLLALGAMMSPSSGKIVLLFQAPFCAAGFFTVAVRSNKDTVALLVARETSNRLARHDTLTGLPNRARINELLFDMTRPAHAQNDARNREAERQPFALLLIDLDGFKAINDSLGHSAGDKVLQESARRLSAVLGVNDIAGRLAGDEFVVIANEAALGDEAELLADRIVKVMARPFILNDSLVHMGASVGVSRFPDHGENGAQLLINADRALYAVKRNGKSAFALFNVAAHASDDNLSLLRSDLEGAMESFASLSVEFQPIVDLASGLVTCREALVRWTHPSRGPLSPAIFVPIAERSGLILSLGAWVLRRSCEQAAAWTDPVVVAVNVSPVQLREPTFAAEVAQVLRETGLPPSRLNIEVTETVLMSDDGPTRLNIEELRALGIGLALDDFGTGFSTMSNLCRFSFDKLKIDSSFVLGAVHRRESAAVVRGIVALAHELGIPTIAEGIETPEQLEFVKACGCTCAQGFLLGRPAAGHSIAKTESLAA